MTTQPNLSNPEYTRIQDTADAAQEAMYHHLTNNGGIEDTYAVIIVASRTHPSVMTFQGAGINEDDAAPILKAVLDAINDGSYRTIEN